jgi:hypothetical protein
VPESFLEEFPSSRLDIRRRLVWEAMVAAEIED